MPVRVRHFHFPSRQIPEEGDTKVWVDTADRPAHRARMKDRSKRAEVNARPLVAVIDDDESVRESLPDLLNELGFSAQVFSSAEEFLESDFVGLSKVLILDVTMPGMSGPELQDELKLRGHATPIVFITARKDDSTRPSLIARGAVECLFKPFSDTALLSAVNAALRVA